MGKQTVMQALLAAYGTPEQKARYEREKPQAEAAMARVLREQTIIWGPDGEETSAS